MARVLAGVTYSQDKTGSISREDYSKENSRDQQTALHERQFMN